MARCHISAVFVRFTTRSPSHDLSEREATSRPAEKRTEVFRWLAINVCKSKRPFYSASAAEDRSLFDVMVGRGVRNAERLFGNGVTRSALIARCAGRVPASFLCGTGGEPRCEALQTARRLNHNLPRPTPQGRREGPAFRVL